LGDANVTLASSQEENRKGNRFSAVIRHSQEEFLRVVREAIRNLTYFRPGQIPAVQQSDPDTDSLSDF
jgi:hypothetical protein